ncbi:hypothetical protein DDE23_02040 [Pararhodobacter aggregans]|uniref:Uncharacterized protein n=1 Tax=Pararhodobacter aggregans TaxID=404875 RepID=A0A2T7UX05_9RHOB|nr:hypothetical protein DDE23_02040 [Pararhodobacter aggregans]
MLGSPRFNPDRSARVPDLYRPWCPAAAGAAQAVVPADDGAGRRDDRGGAGPAGRRGTRHRAAPLAHGRGPPLAECARHRAALGHDRPAAPADLPLDRLRQPWLAGAGRGGHGARDPERLGADQRTL